MVKNLKSRSQDNPLYPERTKVLDSQVNWTVNFPEYNPVDFTHDNVLCNDKTETSKRRTNPPTHCSEFEFPNATEKYFGWADPVTVPRDIMNKKTFYGSNPQGLGKTLKELYDTLPHVRSRIENNIPLNPEGRTGMTGRGLLGNWACNNAADPIVVKRDKDGKYHVVLITRKDTLDLAIPGGMVEIGDDVTVTLKKEFGEEALDTGNTSGDDKTPQQLEDEGKEKQIILDEIFTDDNKTILYKGYVDDPRNTDNAWMETTVALYILPTKYNDRINLTAGDDAGQVAWYPLDESIYSTQPYDKPLYASHKNLLQLAFQTLTMKKDSKGGKKTKKERRKKRSKTHKRKKRSRRHRKSRKR